MKQDGPETNDPATWATSVKERLESHRRESDSSSDEIAVDFQLFDDVCSCLDQVASTTTQSKDKLNGDEFLASIEEMLAHWQANISSAYADASAAQLSELIEKTTQQQSDLQRRELKLTEQQKELEQRLADSLVAQSRLTRQRKVIAAKLKSERSEQRLQLEQLRAEMTTQAEEQARAEVGQEFESVKNRLAEVEAEYQAQGELLEESNLQLENANSQLAESNSQLAKLSADCEALRVAKDGDSQSNDQLRDEVNTLQELVGELEAQLAAAGDSASKDAELAEANQQLQAEVATLKESIENADRTREEERSAAVEELQQQNDQLSQELETLRTAHAEGKQALDASQEELMEELESTRSALKTAHSQIDELEVAVIRQSTAEADDGRTAKLEESLTKATEEIEDLRNQNADLASQLAKKQVADPSVLSSVSLDQESLSWEERKQLILRQLEGDDVEGESAEEKEAARLEIEAVITATNKELEAREREIEELKSIVEQQSDTKQGVAIGAAAIAQMLDSDELVQQERNRLKEIQTEWEEKLRQAEIDLSMERAKLARERTEIEAERNELANSRPEASAAPNSDGKNRTRKWLEHLGLKDDQGS